MSTVRDLITRSLRLIHVLDPGETPTADEANDSLEAANDMLDSMSIPGLYIYTAREDIVSWTANQASRTIGSSGNFNITRPTRIEDGTFCRISDVDYPIKVLRNRSQYNDIQDKTTAGTIPEYIYYEPSHPLGILYLHPVPSATLAVHLQSPEQLDQFTTLETTFAYPPGYREFFVSQLCLRLAAEFGVAVPPEVTAMASRSAIAVRRLNTRIPQAVLEVSAIGLGGDYSVYSDS